jgi:hypothetical protein
LAAIDSVNATDPDLVTDGDRLRPRASVEAELATAWVRRLDPSAGAVPLLAARAHHLRRWELPRGAYPAGRAGYLRWKAEQRRRAGVAVSEALTGRGLDEATVDAVARLVRKDGPAGDQAAQVHEDALCLVFFERNAASVAADLGHERTATVVRKTLAKMSPDGLAAVFTLPLEASVLALVEGSAAGQRSAQADPPGGAGGPGGPVGEQGA